MKVLWLHWAMIKLGDGKTFRRLVLSPKSSIAQSSKVPSPCHVLLRVMVMVIVSVIVSVMVRVMVSVMVRVIVSGSG